MGWEPKQQRAVSGDCVLTLSAREGQHRHRKSCSTWAKARVPQGGARMSVSVSPYASGKPYPRDYRTLAVTPMPPPPHPPHSRPDFQKQACPLGHRTIPVCFRVHLTKCRAHSLPATFATQSNTRGNQHDRAFYKDVWLPAAGHVSSQETA